MMKWARRAYEEACRLAGERANVTCHYPPGPLADIVAAYLKDELDSAVAKIVPVGGELAEAIADAKRMVDINEQIYPGFKSGYPELLAALERRRDALKARSAPLIARELANTDYHYAPGPLADIAAAYLKDELDDAVAAGDPGKLDGLIFWMTLTAEGWAKDDDRAPLGDKSGHEELLRAMKRRRAALAAEGEA